MVPESDCARSEGAPDGVRRHEETEGGSINGEEAGVLLDESSDALVVSGYAGDASQ